MGRSTAGVGARVLLVPACTSVLDTSNAVVLRGSVRSKADFMIRCCVMKCGSPWWCQL